MPKPNPKVLLSTAAGYLRSRPDELFRVVKSAAGLRIGIPLDALRYLVREIATGKKAPTDVVFEAVPPGLRAAASFKVMGSALRARVTLYIEGVDIEPGKALVTARIANLDIEVLDGADSPVAGLIKSGALDLSKPGNLMAFLPNRPPMIVDAKDDRVVLDLLKIPKVASNAKVQKALSVVTPVLNIASIRTREDHLDIQLRASPARFAESVAAARG
ncbi:MAG: hypothetical protein FJ096_04665 [Deltaproteobacteria bacterium]|nr:hypothetical protein [Deltaproteobacteria bacterium]